MSNAGTDTVETFQLLAIAYLNKIVSVNQIQIFYFYLLLVYKNNTNSKGLTTTEFRYTPVSEFS